MTTSASDRFNHDYYQATDSIIQTPENHFLERTQRGTGFFVYRKGEYIVFIPDRRHHFLKSFRPYIGRRRRRSIMSK